MAGTERTSAGHSERTCRQKEGLNENDHSKKVRQYGKKETKHGIQKARVPKVS